MRLRRPPGPALRHIVEELWLAEQASLEFPVRECCLPTGHMHLAFRLSGHPLLLFSGAAGSSVSNLGFAVVSGARSRFYLKDVLEPSCTVGATLKAGASLSLFNAAAGELSERHTRLDDLWSAGTADSARLQLVSEADPHRKLDLLERLLTGRLRASSLHPAITMALERLGESADVGSVVRDSGYSHRYFVAMFRETVGLAPKLYSRVRRFHRAVNRFAKNPAVSWVDLALGLHYSDQAHFTRDFSEFAGITPGEYRKMSPERPHHVLLVPHRTGQFRARQ
jgi:AraC-like DNA-binding protein